MFWFKNVSIYKLTSRLDFSNIGNALQQFKFSSCQPSDISKFGWDSPLITSENLHFEVQNQILLLAKKEQKILPQTVIKKETNIRIEALEKKEQRKLKKTEKQAIKDDVIAVLLPRAFSQEQFTPIWIDTERQFIYVDTSSAKRAEDVLALLRKSLGSLPIIPLTFVKPPIEVMTSWVANNNIPSWLNLLEEAELKSFDTDSLIRCKRQDIESDEIMTHISARKYITKLALRWEDHCSFILNENGSISRLKFVDDITEVNGDITVENVDARFSADFFLMTKEISSLLSKLSNEFDGIKG